MRYDFMKKTGSIRTGTDNVDVDTFDIFNVMWKDFEYTNGFSEHLITKTDVEKPWMVSYKELGSFFYEDVIFLINGIKSVLDLSTGKILKIPKIGDLRTFTNGIKQ